MRRRRQSEAQRRGWPARTHHGRPHLAHQSVHYVSAIVCVLFPFESPSSLGLGPGAGVAALATLAAKAHRRLAPVATRLPKCSPKSETIEESLVCFGGSVSWRSTCVKAQGYDE